MNNILLATFVLGGGGYLCKFFGYDLAYFKSLITSNYQHVIDRFSHKPKVVIIEDIDRFTVDELMGVVAMPLAVKPVGWRYGQEIYKAVDSLKVQPVEIVPCELVPEPMVVSPAPCPCPVADLEDDWDDDDDEDWDEDDDDDEDEDWDADYENDYDDDEEFEDDDWDEEEDEDEDEEFDDDEE